MVWVVNPQLGFGRWQFPAQTPPEPDPDIRYAYNPDPPIVPEGFAVDIFGRVYDERVPAFISTGTEFVIDRLHSATSTKTRGGKSWRLLRFQDLQDLADEQTPAYQWGDNEVGLPPTWWDEGNDGGGRPPSAPGYGDGPEWEPRFDAALGVRGTVRMFAKELEP